MHFRRARGLCYAFGMKQTFRIAAVIPVLLLCLSGCARRPPNILLLTLDTTRADRLGCYDYSKAHTPNLDRLAAEGVLFEHAQSVMPLTTPTHATILTGRLPIEHGIRLNRESILPAEIPSIAEVLKAAGYDTAAVVATRILDAKFGLDRGFGLYDGEKPGTKQLSRPANEITDTALAWLRSRQRSRPFFLWAHYYDPHMPRTPHPRLFPALKDPYDQEVAFMDMHIGRLLEYLRAGGKLDNTLVVAVADHGESLGEHDEILHGFFIYQSTQHVPMIFRWPGGGLPDGLRVSGSVSLNDLMPTMLELSGIKLDVFARKGAPPRTAVDEVMRRSFAHAVTGREPLVPRACHMEALWSLYYFDWAPLSGVVEDGWSYIHAPEPELYSLVADPGETNNLFAVEPRRADEMAMRLEAFERAAVRHASAAAAVSPEEMRRFASLGYLAGNNAAVQNLSADNRFAGRANPKSQSRLILADNRHSMFLSGRNLNDEILDDCILMADAFPDRVGYAISAGRAHLMRARPDEALKYFERAEVLCPTNPVVIRHLQMLRGKTR